MNIVLTGLISCGKTSVGKKLAPKINYHFIDTDDVISEIHHKEKREKQSVQEIYKNYGESYLRDIEKRAIEEITSKDNCVIATGGGTIENQKNAEILKQNSRIIFLDCSLDILVKRIKKQHPRPIFKGLNTIEVLNKMSKKRMPLFKQFSDDIIDVSSCSIDDTVNKIMELI